MRARYRSVINLELAPSLDHEIFGNSGSLSSSALLQTGQGLPAASQSQPRGLSPQRRSGCLSQDPAGVVAFRLKTYYCKPDQNKEDRRRRDEKRRSTMSMVAPTRIESMRTDSRPQRVKSQAKSSPGKSKRRPVARLSGKHRRARLGDFT